jgi:K+-sensing histidine kinase KdpD
MVWEFVSLPFRPVRRPSWYGPLGYAVAIVGIGAATGILWIAQPVVNLGTVNLVYLLVVVGVAVGWGLGQGLLASVLAFLAANFFFTEPRLTFTVASLQDVLALVILLIMAILTSQLVAGLRREAEEARRGQQAAVQAEVLRRTDALRVALLSAVAHDLRTPLTTIKTAATNLLNPRLTWSDDDRHEFLQVISAQVDHINHLVSNLLDMSRIEQGRLRLNKEPHRIADVIETVLERLQPVLSEHLVDTKLDSEIPPVPMDVVGVDEVLTNLLENAAKYTPAGTPIHVGARCGNGFVEVQIADEGPGIPQESLPYLFQRFYRVTAGAGGKAEKEEKTEKTSKPSSFGSPVNFGAGRGWGLGLAIVKGIVEAHGGQVSASNQPNGGAVFTFTLPLQAADSAAKPASVRQLDKQASEPQTHVSTQARHEAQVPHKANVP